MGKDLEEAKAITKAAITSICKNKLKELIVVNGNFIPQITGENRADLKDAISAGITEFKFKSGTEFITLDVSGVEAILQARAKHTQNCFAKEAALYAAVDACTVVEELATINITDHWEVSA